MSRGWKEVTTFLHVVWEGQGLPLYERDLENWRGAEREERSFKVPYLR